MRKLLSTSNSELYHFVGRAALFGLLFVLVAEIFFRVFIPASQVPYTHQNSTYRILQFDPSLADHGIFTLGRLAQHRSPWCINSAGWNSCIEYHPTPERHRPNIAVIGDSFIEGLHVAWPDHIASRLADHLGEKVDAYSFGASGANFSQYINVARYVEETFEADTYVFVLNGNDLAASVRNFGRSPLNLQLRYENGRFEERVAATYVPSRLKRLLRKSALVRYLILNAKVILGLGRADQSPTATNVEVPENRDVILKQAAVYIVNALQEQLPGKDIIIVMNRSGSQIYAAQATDLPLPPLPETLWIQEAVLEAKCFNCRVLDLTYTFSDYYQTTRQRFTFEADGHWTKVGHDLAAQTLASFIEKHDLLRVKSEASSLP